MGFNLGAFAGGAAQGVSRGMEVKKGIADAEFTEKERSRKEAEWKKDDEWKQERSAYQTSAQKFQANQEAYNKAVMENPAAAATLPKPAAPGLHDEFRDIVELTRIDVAHGKKGADTLFPMIQNLKRMEDEGLTQTLQQALAGDTQGALKTFASTGEKRDIEGIRFEPSEFDPGNGIKPIKSRVMVFPDGRRMDAVGTLWAQQQAKDLIGSVVNQQKLNNDTARTEATVAHQQGTLGETVRHNKASEANDKIKAQQTVVGESTSEIRNVKFLLQNNIAANALEAWKMVKTGTTPAGEKIISDGAGGVLVVNHEGGQISKIDRRGRTSVIREGEGDEPAVQDVHARFAADQAMAGYRLGNQTAQGVEVLDASGKLAGHYN